MENHASNVTNFEPATTLNISAFKDITAFVLETAKSKQLIDVNIKYVKNADEAHSDLMNKKADLVFMSYDDTLSIALESGYSDIAAIIPIHGGILSLCGDINLAQNKNKIGIDTDSGYARALRVYLQQQYPVMTDYERLAWLFVGATNLRVDELFKGNIDATLLNPPYSYQDGVKRIIRMYDAIGSYQGIVVNINKSWLSNPNNAAKVTKFVAGYYAIVQEMKNQPNVTILKLANYYGVTTTEAAETYNSLWEADGLSLSPQFNLAQLEGTESIFSNDFTPKIIIPESRDWIIDYNII